MFMRNHRRMGVLTAAVLVLAMSWQAEASDSQIVAGQIKSTDTELPDQTELSETEISESGQRKAVIRVVSITGNELTYYEVQEEPSGNAEESGTGDSYRSGKNGNGGRMNRNTKTVYLPVPVVVHTDTNEEMTFSILEAEDELEVLFEEVEGEEIITEIWMKSAEDDDR